MGDMSPCKHGGTVGYCGICNPELEELTNRITELEAILEPLQFSVDKAESLGRKVQDWIAYAKKLEADSGAAIGEENSRLRTENARLTTHIRAIAEHHDKQINFVESSDDIDYQTMRRDFALSGLEGE